MTTLESKPKMELAVYMDSMTNATIVKEGIAEMAQNLFSIHTVVSETSGIVRQFSDDTKSPDGTFNARFDYVNKKVELENDKTKVDKDGTIISGPLATNNTTKDKVVYDNSVKESLGTWLTDIWSKVKVYFSSFRKNSRHVDVAITDLIENFKTTKHYFN